MHARTRTAAALALFAAYAALVLGARAVPQHDVVLVVALLFAALRLGEGLPERRRWIAVFSVSSIVLAISLAWLWRVGFAGRHHVFGGVVALSDAHGYYEDAERALHGLSMNDGGVRRPLSVAVLAGILRLTDNHIRVALALVTFGWAAAVASVTTEVWRTHGRTAAGIVGIAFLLFARRYVGFVQPEGLAGPVGALSFCLLWRAVGLAEAGDRRACSSSFAGALLLLTVALFARPGPFTAVLGVLGWGIFVALRRREPGAARVDARAVAAAATFRGGAAVLGGWLLHRLVQRATSPAPSFGDYPAILYGILHGEDHTFLHRHNPWLDALPAPEQAGAAMALLRQEIAAHPSSAPVALARCFASHLVLPQGLFGFVWANPDDRVLEDKAVVARVLGEHGPLGPLLYWIEQLGVYSLLNAVVMALLGAAFVVLFVWAAARALRRRGRARDPHVSLLLFLASGVLLSWPLLPPWITEGAQIHATVFVPLVALPAIVFFGKKRADPPLPPSRPWVALVVPAALLALVGLVLVAPLHVPGDRACDRPDAFYVEPDRGARIAFGERADATIPRGDTDENLSRLERRNGAVVAALRRASARSSEIVPGFDACRGKLYYFVDGDDTFARTPARWLSLEGEALDPDPLVTVSQGP